MSSRLSRRPLTKTTVSSTSWVDTSWYVAGKNMHSMEPARSSTVAIAQALPCLVILRWRPEMMPPMVTTAPSACSPPVSWEIAASALSDRTCSMPKSGWSET